MESDLIQTTSPEIKCSICLADDIEDFSLCSTDCSHQFCKKCLDEWFDQEKISCPMCRNDIKYFNYQGGKNRIVKISTSVNNQHNVQLINNLRLNVKFYKIAAYFLLIYSLYTTYNLNYYEDVIKLYGEQIDNCLKNQTDNDIYINHLNNEIKILDEELNTDPSSSELFSLVNVIINDNIYSCLLPEYFVDKCIDSLPI